MSKPRLYTALQFQQPTPEGLIHYISIIIPAFTRADAEKILREEGYINSLTETFLLNDWAAEKSPICKIVDGADNHKPTTIKQHANWLRVMTLASRHDGEVTPPTWVRVR